MNNLSEDWKDDVPDWDGIDFGDSVELPRGMVEDIIDTGKKGLEEAKEIVGILTNFFIDELRQKELTLGKCMFVIEHMYRINECTHPTLKEISKVEVPVGGNYYLSSSTIKKMSKEEYDEVKKHSVKNDVFMQHLFGLAQTVFAENDIMFMTMQQRMEQSILKENENND